MIEALRREIERISADNESLRWILEFSRRDKTRLLEKLASASHIATRVTVLYAALDRLHSDVEPETVIAAIDDLLLNVIGAEQFVIFNFDDDALVVTHRAGVDAGEVVGSEVRRVVEATIASGRASVRRGDAGKSPSAFIPLRIGCRPYGAIAILGLNGRKQEFTAGDLELFDLLATHAAVALYSSSLHRLI